MKTISVFLVSILLLGDIAWLCGGQANDQGNPSFLETSTCGTEQPSLCCPTLTHTAVVLLQRRCSMPAVYYVRLCTCVCGVDLFSHFFPGMGKKSDFSGTSTSAHAEATASVKPPPGTGKAADVEGKGDVSTQTKSIITTSARTRHHACKGKKCRPLTLLPSVTSCAVCA